MSWFKKKVLPPSPRDKALELILAMEGGYVHDPRDPGGETNYGISKRQYPDINIKKMSEQDAKDIYIRDYWDKCRCDEMPGAIAIALFDSAVNQGVGAAARMLQSAVGALADGKIGPVTIAAVMSKPARRVISHFMAERAIRYSSTRNFEVFGKGWMRRVMEITAEAAIQNETEERSI